jgi:pimeloyl-ACP methyl ester carboxylesterase
LVHGNGSSIGTFKAQIDYFRKHYRVIAMDSRDQGKSADSPDKITYEKMTDDLAALLAHLPMLRQRMYWAGAMGVSRVCYLASDIRRG